MASLGDAVVQFPVSGSSFPSAVYVRFLEQVHSSSFSTYYRPSGVQSDSVLMLPANPDRKALLIFNSGTLPVGLGFAGPMSAGQYSYKLTGLTSFNNLIPGFVGDIYGRWDGSGSLSSSIIFFTEFF